MAQDFARSFYNSSPWRRCRASYIAKRVRIDGGLCECCRERQGYIVHHRIRLTAENIGDPEVSLNHANLRFECKDCHDLEDGHGVNACLTPAVLFDTDGNVIGTA